MGYDAFLSHSHADKSWVKRLHDRLSGHDFNGRNLRVWLDENVLDPGALSSERELNSALDQSRMVVVVATDESMQSSWVQQEFRYFLEHRDVDDVIVIRRGTVVLDPLLRPCKTVEWTSDADDDTSYESLLKLICGVHDDFDAPAFRHQVRRAFEASLHSQPGGFDPSPTGDNSNLLRLLLSHNISNPAEDGPALTGFEQLGQLLVDINGQMHYGTKMAAGEFLAVALLSHPRYREASQRFLDLETQIAVQPSFMQRRNRMLHPNRYGHGGSNLRFVVVRAAAKIAEVAPRSVDISTLWAVLHSLDGKETLTGEEKALTMLVGRTLAKLSPLDSTVLLIHSLARFGGEASKRAAAAAIQLGADVEIESVFYTEELKALSGGLPSSTVGPNTHRRYPLAPLLLNGPLTDPLDAYLKNCREELIASCSRDIDISLSPSVPPCGPSALRIFNGPIAGTVCTVCLGNMEAVAPHLTSQNIACLTEPRIVDDLLTGAGAFLVAAQSEDSPLCRRLRNRRSRFAMLDNDVLHALCDGDHITLPVPRTPDARTMGLKIRYSAQ